MTEEYFEVCLQRINEEILPILQSFPPKIPNDPDGILNGSIDLILYRNLIFALEFCFQETNSRLTCEQLNKLGTVVKSRVIPAYLKIFKENFLMKKEINQQASSYFYVRQENNASWPKLIWERIKQIYFELESKKSEESHELGVKMPSGVLDVLARLLEFFFPTEEIEIEIEVNSENIKDLINSKSNSKSSFSLKKFELINFDLRLDAPEVLEAILQRALIERQDSIMSKNAFYILNRIVSFSREWVVWGNIFVALESKSNFNNLLIWSKEENVNGQARKWEQFIVAFGSVQESQIHLVKPLLPVIRELMRGMPSGWWRVLLQKGMCNDSVPIRRLIIYEILCGTSDEDMKNVFCTPEGLDFCLEDFLKIGLDPNAAFLVTPQQVFEGELGLTVDLGEEVSVFFSRVIDTFAGISSGHGKAIVREILIALERWVRAPVVLIYILKAFSQVTPFPALEDADYSIIGRIAGLPSLHNQRARLLVKKQLTQILKSFSNPSDISFEKLAVTLSDLLSESLNLGAFTVKQREFGELAQWLDETFGKTFLQENLTIAIERFYRTEGSREKARILGLMAVFSLGSGDGRFVSYSRPVFEQLALINTLEQPQEAIPAFTLFLALNETVLAVLRGENDLLAQLSLTGRLFDWLEFIDGALFGPEMRIKVDFNSANILLEAFSLLIHRASENDQNQLIQFLDIHVFSWISFLKSSTETESNQGCTDFDVSFKRLLTISAVMIGVSAILKKLRGIDHLPRDLITPDLIQKTIRFKLERPGGLSESEWDQWPEFVTSFTAAKWKCVEAMTQSYLTFTTAQEGREELLSVLASCLQALEVSKYGGTLAILRCMTTLFDLIFINISEKDENSNRQFCSITNLAVQIFKNTLRGGSETQRWFDSYAEFFINLFFRPNLLKASANSELLLESLHEVFDFIVTEIGPKRRAIVGLMSARLGEYWCDEEEALSAHWRGQLIKLLIYGPIRGSVDESVAARVNREHVPDSDYQVRVHAVTVLNHLTNYELICDLLVDLLGQQEALSALKKKMFPGDFGHRLRLRSWSAILLLIGIVCNLKNGLSESIVENDLLPTIWRLVGEESMGSTRIFIEWSLSRLYLRFPSLITSDFLSARILYRNVSASLIISMLTIALNMVKRMPEKDLFLSKMTNLTLPLLAHNNQTVRMHAIHAFKEFEGQKIVFNLESSCLGYTLLAEFIEKADHCQKFIKKLEEEVFISPNGIDPIDDLNLDWIFGKLMKLGGIDGEAIEFYSFMNYRETEGTVPFNNTLESNVKATEDFDYKKFDRTFNTIEELKTSNEVTELFKEFQTKIDIYSPFAMDEGEDIQGITLPSLNSDNKNLLETEIIMIGSFLDKLPNLAGLARSCEIFGVKTLYVPDLEALASPDFLNVAMTAERWLDIRQLSVKDIPEFLKNVKEQHGFTIIALEQTSNSIPLQSYTFPKRTCIVLGNERLGITAEVLHLVDDCVEIPQFGRVRSLNVHVSGSLAIWKAREQDLI